MIDVKKVRMMTWLSAYENGAGRKDLKMNQQSRRTYKTLRLIESVIIVTIVFMAFTVLYGFRFITKSMSSGQSLSLMRNLLPLGIVYLAVMVLTVIITNLCCDRKYRAMQKRVAAYDKSLYRLQRYLEETDPE